MEEGEIQSLLFFMIEGVVRGYVIKADGQDISDSHGLQGVLSHGKG